MFFEQYAGPAFDLQLSSQKLVLSFDIPDGLMQLLNLFQLLMGHFDDIFINFNLKRLLNYQLHLQLLLQLLILPSQLFDLLGELLPL